MAEECPPCAQDASAPALPELPGAAAACGAHAATLSRVPRGRLSAGQQAGLPQSPERHQARHSYGSRRETQMEKSSLQARRKQAHTLPNTPLLSNILHRSPWNRLVLPSRNDHRTPRLRRKSSVWSTGISMESATEQGLRTQQLVTLPDCPPRGFTYRMED